MTRIAIVLGGVVLLAGCQMSSEEDQLENAVRTSLASRGEVKQIEFTKTDANHMTGFAIVHPTGAAADARVDCTAERVGGKGSNFNWRCQPTLDEALLSQTEASIRQTLAQRGTVGAVDMTRQDADHMTGYAIVRGADGADARYSCTGERDATRGDFAWHCTPPTGEEAAPAEQGAADDAGDQQAPPGDEAPK